MRNFVNAEGADFLKIIMKMQTCAIFDDTGFH